MSYWNDDRYKDNEKMKLRARLGLLDRDGATGLGIAAVIAGCIGAAVAIIISIAAVATVIDANGVKNGCEKLSTEAAPTVFVRGSFWHYGCYIEVDGRMVAFDQAFDLKVGES